ncbi:MAG: DNRLRE domain-containing protein [Bacteroidota bacterium]|nr:DNRLRE domain-containing protein [Bacteroidota bacterium]
MKHCQSLIGCCLLFLLLSGNSTAQYYQGELINSTITLRSDAPSKSVLVTKIPRYGIGHISPLIIAAGWTDYGRKMECRSLLKFNYNLVPELIITDPSSIRSVELILYPANTALTHDDMNKPRKLFVKRVAESWEDTVTTWDNQPMADTSTEVTKLIKPKNKNNPVTINVTKLVVDMFRFGNNGFIICPENSTGQSIAARELFGSPKNKDETLRSILVINYREVVGTSLRTPDAGGRTKQIKTQQTFGNTTTITQPVNNNTRD